jgi:predicted nucleotidyltransferase
MDERLPKADLEDLAAFLNARGVRFIVIGGQAEYLFGSPRVTFDIDICYERSSENLERLALALKEMRVSLRDAPPDLPFQIDARTLTLGNNFTFNSIFGHLDLLGHVEPIGSFEDLARSATKMPLAGQEVLVISLDDLIAIKRHIGRAKDRESLLQLLAIKRERDATGLK